MRHRKRKEAISNKEREFDATSEMLKMLHREKSKKGDWLRTRRFSMVASCSQDYGVIFQCTWFAKYHRMCIVLLSFLLLAPPGRSVAPRFPARVLLGGANTSQNRRVSSAAAETTDDPSGLTAM